MVWIIAILASAAVMSITNITDSHLLSKKMPSLAAYLLPIGMTHLVIGSIMLAVFSFPADAVLPVLAAIGTGLINGAAAILVLNTMRQGEVSRIIPVISSSPIFVALLSVPLLGEAVGLQDWLGILLTVAGAILVSIQRDGNGRKVKLQKSFILLVAASLMYAISNVSSKYALETISFWTMFSLNSICCAIVHLLYSARKTTFGELKNLKQPTRTLGMTVANQCIVCVGVLLSFFAVEKGPISLVSAVANIRPAFVFLIAVTLSRFFPGVVDERLTRGTVILKFSAIAIIIGGVTLLTLAI